MLKALVKAGGSRGYWLAIIVLGLSMEAVALFYQYVLEYYPCVLCIHTRIWVMGLVLAGVAGLLLRRTRPLRILTHVLVSVLFAGLMERSWKLFGTERGLIEGSCSMDSGLPSWFALDSWLPTVFKVWEPCGYTPELLFGVTMAEALLAGSTIFLLVSVLVLLAVVVTPDRAVYDE